MYACQNLVGGDDDPLFCARHLFAVLDGVLPPRPRDRAVPPPLLLVVVVVGEPLPKGLMTGTKPTPAAIPTCPVGFPSFALCFAAFASFRSLFS